MPTIDRPAPRTLQFIGRGIRLRNRDQYFEDDGGLSRDPAPRRADPEPQDNLD